MNNTNSQIVDTCHEEIIHDISFNYYGNRFATASTDQTIKVYSKVDGKWIKDCEQKCHDGPIWRVRWAHPKYGSLIATCSHDKGVSVWEEKKFIEDDPQNKKSIVRSQWTQRSMILETREGVADIQFGCKQHGLVLAVAFLDGKLQIYRLLDQNQLLSAADVKAMVYGIKSISWNTSPVETEMIAVGGNNIDQRYRPTVAIEGKESNKFSMNEVATGQSIQLEQQVSTLVIYIKREKNIQDQAYTLEPLKYFESTNTINDVQWGNQNGRSFHLLATADSNGLTVWKFTVKDSKIEILEKMNVDQKDRNEIAWRVSWNLLANIVAVSYSKEKIKVYHNVNNTWLCKAQLEESQDKIEYQ